MRRIVALALVAPSLPRGCTVGPTYHRPSHRRHAGVQGGAARRLEEAEPNEGIPRGRWWEIYNDPQLNDARVEG